MSKKRTRKERERHLAKLEKRERSVQNIERRGTLAEVVKINRKGNVYVDEMNYKRLMYRAEHSMGRGDFENFKRFADYQIELYKESGETVTGNALLSLDSENRRVTMFIQAGSSIEEQAQAINVDPTELLNESSWDGQIFTAGDGRRFVFRFNYEDELMVRVL